MAIRAIGKHKHGELLDLVGLKHKYAHSKINNISVRASYGERICVVVNDYECEVKISATADFINAALKVLNLSDARFAVNSLSISAPHNDTVTAKINCTVLN